MDATRIPDDPDHTVPTRRVVDVTNRLTPGAAALVRERTAAMLDEQAAHPPFVIARLRDAVEAAREQQGPIPAGFYTLPDAPPQPWHDAFEQHVTTITRQVRNAEEDRLRAAFDGGRAYERGAAIRRRVGKSLTARRAAAQEAATQYLDERTPQAATLAALVLAGFTGAAPEAVA